MRLAIIGSRDFKDYHLFCKALDKFLNAWKVQVEEIEQVVSGGAKGADSLAERWATEHNLHMKIFYPDWRVHGRAAGPIRNALIIKHCTHVVAFPSITGRGTQDSIRKAQTADKPTKALWFDSPDPTVDRWYHGI